MQKQFQRFVKQVEKNKREAGRAKKKKQILTTYSGYKKSQVLSDLEKAIINSNIEKTTSPVVIEVCIERGNISLIALFINDFETRVVSSL